MSFTELTSLTKLQCENVISNCVRIVEVEDEILPDTALFRN